MYISGVIPHHVITPSHRLCAFQVAHSAEARRDRGDSLYGQKREQSSFSRRHRHPSVLRGAVTVMSRVGDPRFMCPTYGETLGATNPVYDSRVLVTTSTPTTTTQGLYRRGS